MLLMMLAVWAAKPEKTPKAMMYRTVMSQVSRLPKMSICSLMLALSGTSLM